MSVTSASVAVGNTATALNTAGATGLDVAQTISVGNTGASPFFVGGSGVTVTSGLPVAAGTTCPVTFQLDVRDVLFAVSATSSTAAVVISQG